MKTMDRPSDTDVLRQVEEAAWHSDRTFFQQHPRRRFRIRPAWDVEVEDFVRHSGEPRPTLKAGDCWWIVVHQVRPGARSRLLFTASHTLPPEASERDARRIWSLLCAPGWAATLRELDQHLTAGVS
jgi:hypothetical protein